MSESSVYNNHQRSTGNNQCIFLFVDFSYGDNGTFSPPMDVTNQMQNSNIQLTSGNSNYSSGSGGDSPTSLSPGRKTKVH